MPKNVTKFKMFVASPSDVLDERAAMDEVVRELNLTYGAPNNLILELVKWETHTAPGIDIISTQNVINDDIGEDYDLFIGVIWKKFGTPTAVAGSGTEEEFDRAYSKFISNPNSMQILFYFKTAPPKSLTEIIPEELIKVQKFKEKLQAANVLYSEFNAVNELQSFLRLHIPKRIDNILRFTNAQTIAAGIETTKNINEDEEELGLIDYQEIRDEYMADSNEALVRIVEATEWIGNRVTEKAEELNGMHKIKKELSNKEVRDFCLRVASVMDDYANRIDIEIPIFIDGFERAGNAMLNIIKLRQKGVDVDKEAELKVIEGLIASIQHGKSGMSTFLNSVSTLPRMSKELNKARRNVEEKLSLLISKLDFSNEIMLELQNSLVNS